MYFVDAAAETSDVAEMQTAEAITASSVNPFRRATADMTEMYRLELRAIESLPSKANVWQDESVSDQPSLFSSDDMVRAEPIVVYTDGACSGNPGPGGWGWAVSPDGSPSGAGGEVNTTNQRMELAAVLEALRTLLPHHQAVHVVSDSTYVVNCFRDGWWKKWKKNGWKNSKREPVANVDLWEPLIELVTSHEVSFQWVKGHSGHPMNDLVDGLAVAAAQQISNT